MNKEKKVNSFAYIKDRQTKQDIFDLYGIFDENTYLLAIHTGEGANEKIGLYMANNQMKKLERLESEYIPVMVKSKGEEIVVEDQDGIINLEKEIQTMVLGNVELAFYLNNEGNMKIARAYDDRLLEIETYIPDNNPEKKTEEKKTNLDEIQHLDMSNPKSAEKIREIIRERMKKRNNLNNSQTDIKNDLKKNSEHVFSSEKLQAEAQKILKKKQSDEGR